MPAEQLELYLGCRAATGRMARQLLDRLNAAPQRASRGMAEGLTITVRRSPPRPTLYDLLVAYAQVQARFPRTDHD